MDPPQWIYDIQYLVFSGGGVLGYAYAGAILALDNAFLKQNKNLYQQLKGVSGASIGASFALMITLGVRGNQLLQEILRVEPSRVMDDFKWDNLMSMYGMSPKSYFLKCIYDLLERYTGDGRITFQSLYNLTKKHLVVSVSNVTKAQVEYHSYLTTPHYPVFESVCASMSIPVIFAPTILSQGSGDWLVDGGLMDNMPFSMFPPELTLMMSLRSNMPEPTSLRNYIQRVLMMTANNVEAIMMRSLSKPLQNHRLILRLHDVSTIQFNISVKHRYQLIQMGMKIMLRFLFPRLLVRECMKKLLQTCFLLNESLANTTTTTTTPTPTTTTTPTDITERIEIGKEGEKEEEEETFPTPRKKMPDSDSWTLNDEEEDETCVCVD